MLVTIFWFSQWVSILFCSLSLSHSCSPRPLFFLSFSPSFCAFFLFLLTEQNTEQKYIFSHSVYQLNFLSVPCSKKYMSGMFSTLLLSCSKHTRTHAHINFLFLKEPSSNLFCQLLTIDSKNQSSTPTPHLYQRKVHVRSASLHQIP